MPNTDETTDSVRIFAPDKALLKKLGGINLDVVFSPQAVAGAQQIIERSAGQFVDECKTDMDALEKWAAVLKNTAGKKDDTISNISSAAFAIKTKAGLGGYDLVSMIAKSLQLYSEKIITSHLVAADISILVWHVESMKQLFALKMKGRGGAAGEAILSELNKLAYMADDASPDVRETAAALSQV